MNDWAAPIIAVALFGFLTPGLLFQMPGKHRPVDFVNMKTSLEWLMITWSEKKELGARNKDERKVENGVDHNGCTTRMKVAELNESTVTRHLEKETRR
ncbi:hypothetical protein IFM89_025148 [Coptis chinensis]|uniref:Uncharacterized protein n=1 Tax=Coptis chinensis TaxID=261450 RepID=A0A835HX86_9MAGN|nr:hypothetical protein IFM89_025148 [Coptis chinensis]